MRLECFRNWRFEELLFVEYGKVSVSPFTCSFAFSFWETLLSQLHICFFSCALKNYDIFFKLTSYSLLELLMWFNIILLVNLEYDEDDNPREETIKPMVDGGTEGFKGHARVIMPGVTPCFECTIWLFPPQVKFPLCTLAETPRTAAHCIEYAHLIKWDEVHNGKAFDPDDPDHMKWVYNEAVKRADLFGIPGVTYSLTQGVVKNIIPAIASTNAVISAACALEALKIMSGCSKTLSNYLTYNGGEGLHTKVTEFVKDKDCLVCGPGVLIELDVSITLQKLIDQLEEDPKLLISKASIIHQGKNLYMQAPPVLEEMTRSNLSLPLYNLMGKVSKDVIHVSGMASKNDKKISCLRKLRVVFKGIDGVTDMDMAGGA
ncbi:NEDD8-activating enzyme E1 catalytic subunit isoform X3 [Carica papaya]|uniref:NEDD8-activating enzyme E1 catalytic subunit isoform X3 n=1 Tax=Carica papaya TaxID=3649 RepID=UPI000B8D03E3|nr:NEDD8-activating enzyme E1 catalytic subunit isoform X3 [Carica papaya]